MLEDRDSPVDYDFRFTLNDYVITRSSQHVLLQFFEVIVLPQSHSHSSNFHSIFSERSVGIVTSYFGAVTVRRHAEEDRVQNATRVGNFYTCALELELA